MDVSPTTPTPPSRPDVALRTPPATRTAPAAASTSRRPAEDAAVDSGPAGGTDAPSRAAAAREDWQLSSSLKFTVSTADVDAKFAIHEETGRVIVTMYDRNTGEVLKEFPEREILDMVAKLVDAGLHVDTVS